MLPSSSSHISLAGVLLPSEPLITFAATEAQVPVWRSDVKNPLLVDGDQLDALEAGEAYEAGWKAGAEFGLAGFAAGARWFDLVVTGRARCERITSFKKGFKAALRSREPFEGYDLVTYCSTTNPDGDQK